MVADIQGVPFEGSVKSAATRTEEEYERGFPASAHLDDGTYYPGMDKEKVSKPVVKPGQKEPATTKPPVKPPVKPPAPVPAKPPAVAPVKPAPVKPGASAAPVRLAAELVNASGQADAGNKIAGIMQSRALRLWESSRTAYLSAQP